jgi:hypothetical protein
MSKGKLEEHGAAIADASESPRTWGPASPSTACTSPTLVLLCPICRSADFAFAHVPSRYAKAFYRRGLSYLAILRPTAAVPDFKMALEIEPGNRAIREQLDATRKLIRRIEFEKVGPGGYRGGDSGHRDNVLVYGLIWFGTAGSSHIEHQSLDSLLATPPRSHLSPCSSVIRRTGDLAPTSPPTAQYTSH